MSSTPIAALFVDARGPYAGIANVEVWTRDGGSLFLFGGDHRADARTYDGDRPVVAHPPCERWCRLAGLVEARWGHARGDDGGAFDAALRAVRRCGGVLEHPAWSDAWPAFGLPRPRRSGGWVRGACGGWSCYVEQGRYGHPAKKGTFLYAFGALLPALDWSDPEPDARSTVWVSYCGNHTRDGRKRPRVSKREASRTPPAFRDLLISMARSATPAQREANELANVARWPDDCSAITTIARSHEAAE